MHDLGGPLRGMMETNDPLAVLAKLVGSVAGRELSPDALQCLAFMRHWGCADYADRILEQKGYQVSLSDLSPVITEFSKAQAQKEMIEAQAAANAAQRV